VSVSEQRKFREAVRRLHYEKSAAYGNSWKRRGELISILANLARKVDRLEYVAAGAPVSRDENVFDTAVDLLVYSLKYQTYLADLGVVPPPGLRGAAVYRPFSDSTAGFDLLLDTLDLAALDSAVSTQSAAEASAGVVNAFSDLEQCFSDLHAPAPEPERLKRAIQLTTAAAGVVVALRVEALPLYRSFLATWGGAE
jgi:hypothetical protein